MIINKTISTKFGLVSPGQSLKILNPTKNVISLNILGRNAKVYVHSELHVNKCQQIIHNSFIS